MLATQGSSQVERCLKDGCCSLLYQLSLTYLLLIKEDIGMQISVSGMPKDGDEQDAYLSLKVETSNFQRSFISFSRFAHFKRELERMA